MNKKVVSATLGIMCLILTLAIIVQYKTVKDANKIAGASGINSELKSEVLIWKEKYDEAYKKLETSEKELEKQREEASKKDTTSSESERALKLANAVIGTTDVQGKGIVLTVADNKNVTSESISALDSISNYLIHDSDLLTLINELKNAGAEAISINEQRLVTTSAIECDGNIIKVNGEKVGAPFTIKAIGLPEVLINVNRFGGYLDNLRENRYLKVSIEKMTDKKTITIPKYTGVMKFQYAQSK